MNSSGNESSLKDALEKKVLQALHIIDEVR